MFSSAAATSLQNKSIIIAGATGAVGRELVIDCVQDSRINRIVCLSRHVIPQTEWNDTFPGIDLELAYHKLCVIPVDWEKLAGVHEATVAPSLPSELVSHFTGHHFAAECLGTTRVEAGGNAGFERCDLDYVAAFIRCVKQYSGSTLEHFCQMSAEGASPDKWSTYLKVKGKADEIAIAANFEHLTLLRPGLLKRKEKTRFTERIAALFVTAIPVARVARAIMNSFFGARAEKLVILEDEGIERLTPGWTPPTKKELKEGEAVAAAEGYAASNTTSMPTNLTSMPTNLPANTLPANTMPGEKQQRQQGQHGMPKAFEGSPSVPMYHKLGMGANAAGAAHRMPMQQQQQFQAAADTAGGMPPYTAAA